MKTIITDRAVLEEISSLELKAYLVAQGWMTAEKIKDKALVLTKEGLGTELILPLRKDLGDFVLRMSELLSTVSEIENRSMLSLIDDINKSGVDVLRVRMTEGTADGTIPLSATTDVFYNSREMLLAAACAAKRPSKVFGTKKSEEAYDYLKKVRVGQTEYGSFILTFLSPVAPKLTPDQPTFDGMEVEEDPFERLTTKTLLRGLNAAKDAAIGALSDGGIAAFENAVSFGVSANLCDAISNIVNSAGKAEISLTWAKTRPVLKQTMKNVVSFDRQTVEVIAEAARNFRRSEPLLNQPITGWVYQLRQEQSGDPEGTIRISTTINEKPRKLKITLSTEDYHQAAVAHNSGKHISLEGDLYLQGKATELRNPRNLVVIDQDDD
ncbi:MAG: hypothetical protein PHX43_01430 [Alphaproteobacteria bacterium]|nr:hypothetical protein [Alphaproteobacteria bacterium]